MDSGFKSLTIIAQIHQVAVDVSQLAHQFGCHGEPTSVDNLLLAAKATGFKAKLVKLSDKTIKNSVLPAIVCSGDGSYFVLARTSEENGQVKCLVQRPSCTKPEVLSFEELKNESNNQLILFSLANNPNSAAREFNLSWFIPSLVKYRKMFGEVIVASFFLQLFALVTPLFFQVVMDKVLVHKGFTTLNVLAFGFVVVAVFDTLLGGLRNYLFSHTTNRVDVELGAKLFHYLVSLPLAWFESRQVGQSVARVRELDTIRNFITGSSLTLIIDLFFTFVFFAVLWYYSPLLTWIVLGTLPFYIALSIFITPILRHRVDEKFKHGAVNQSFLTEAISGIETLKAQAVEPQMQRRWEDQISKYVTASFRAKNLNNVANQIASLIR